MKKSSKLVTLVCLATAATGAIHVINKTINVLADKLNTLSYDNGNNYPWRFGNIFYTKRGQGSPVLLIHELSASGSSVEWDNVVEEYSKNHTVYAIDLLGCGRSDKPGITYTNFLYVQLISDFVREVIGTRTNVIASGNSASIATMACFSDNSIFDKILFVNPSPIASFNQGPTYKRKMAKFLFELPIIGTLVYNICLSKKSLEATLKEIYFDNPYNVNSSIVNAYYEAAHKSGSKSKYLFASLVGKYTTVNIGRALKEINNSILIIHSNNEKNIESTVDEYVQLNPSIETLYISNSKRLPHLENPSDFLDMTKIYIG